jgi:hypothetical protein
MTRRAQRPLVVGGFILFMAALIAADGPAFGLAPTPVGSEIVIATGIGRLGPPDVGVAANGDAVVAWSEFNSIFFPPNPDEIWSIRSVRVDPMGAMSSPVTIAQPITLPPSGPPVIVPQVNIDVTADGSFAALVEAWESFSSDLRTTTTRYDSSDTPVLGNVLLHNGFLDTFAQMARAPNGDLFVVWNQQTEGGNYSNSNITGRRFTASGTPLGPAFQVNTTTLETQNIPSIAADPSGNMIVVWYYLADDFRIDAQRYDPSGNPVGGEITLATGWAAWNFNGAGAPTRLQVAFTPTGGFMVVGSTGFPVARRFDANGTPLGPTFELSASVTNAPVSGLAIDSDGSFVVIWESDSFPTVPFLRGRRFSRSGQPLGIEFQVSSQTGSAASVGGNGAGEFVVAWLNGAVPSATIRMQRFVSPPLPPSVPALGPIGLIVLAGTLAAIARKPSLAAKAKNAA